MITGDGTGLTYEPNANANGADTFTYTIDDDHGGTDTATVQRDDHPGQRRPRGHERHAHGRRGRRRDRGPGPHATTRTSMAITRTITAKTNGAKGVVAITGGGTGLTYKPNLNANGSDSFTYTIDDGHGATDDGDRERDDHPGQRQARRPQRHGLHRAAGRRRDRLAVLANDVDADGDTLLITAKTERRARRGRHHRRRHRPDLQPGRALLRHGRLHLHRQRRPRRHRHRDRAPDRRQGHAEAGHDGTRRDRSSTRRPAPAR